MTSGGFERLNAWYEDLPDLGTVLRGRHNNFDLIRLVAAIAVLWGHAVFFTPGYEGLPDPVAWISDSREYAGSIAVDTFFLVSGLLISASMERHRHLDTFCLARIARLWPGYIVCVAVMVYLVAPIVSGIDILDRRHLDQADVCLGRNLLFPILDDCSGLPQSFPQSPMPNSFGYPFWTIVTETHCYAMVLSLGLALRGDLTKTPGRAAAYLVGIAAFVVAISYYSARSDLLPAVMRNDIRLLGGFTVLPVLFFVAGMVLYALRSSVKISWTAAVSLSFVAFLPRVPRSLGYVALGYTMLVISAWRPLYALRPRRDLSYGIYIYGAGMQQVTFALTGVVSPWIHFAGAATLSVFCALLSHALVEAPALRLGRRAIAYLDRT